jgi:transcriptional activator protein UGA3
MIINFDEPRIKPDLSTSVPIPMSKLVPTPQTGKRPIRIIEVNEYYHLMTKAKRSKRGCLTCKIRKKKCDETRPKCHDCVRLNKDCIWLDPQTMSEETMRRLREKVEAEESTHKLRKRQPRVNTTTDAEQVVRSGVQKPVEPSLALTSSNSAHSNGIPRVAPKLASTEPAVSSPSFITSTITNNGLSMSLRHSPEYLALSPSLLSLVAASQNLQAEPLDDEFSNRRPLSPSDLISILNGLDQLGPVVSPPQQDDLRRPRDGANKGKHEEMPMFDVRPDHPRHKHWASSSVLPELYISPSILPNLSRKHYHLYRYYCDIVSKQISISPVSQTESNSYQKVFLPLAHQDEGVLNGVLAWACFHIGGDWSREGFKFVDKALDHISDNLQVSRHKQGSMDLHDAFDLEEDRNSTIYKLATLLILCGAEICKGDVKNWSVYLSWGKKILANNGGILKFNRTIEENWLISNFAYHDFLASSTGERGTYFPSEQYELVLRSSSDFSRGRLNPLLGVCKELFRIIGDVGSLVFQSRKLANGVGLDDMERTLPEVSANVNLDEFGARAGHHINCVTLLGGVLAASKLLETEIKNAKPSRGDLEDLTDEELELHLTLFEAIQIAAKLFIRQAVLKVNPSAIESQVLAAELIECLDILVGTPVQASLVFPFFMAGIHSVSSSERLLMQRRISTYKANYVASNVGRVEYILEKIWASDPYGDSVVDWYRLLRELGWELNFA